MSRHLTAGQQALLTAELEQRERQLREQLQYHLHGQSRVERAHEVLTQDGDDAPQRRPEQAVAAGVSYMVIGRPVTQAADPAAALRAINAGIGVA